MSTLAFDIANAICLFFIINPYFWSNSVMNDLSNSSDDLPKSIKAIRQKLGLSQEELAQKLGVSFTSVNRWENGQTIPSKLARRQIEALCKKLNCQTPIFGRKD